MYLDPTKPPVKRDFLYQVAQYYRATINFNDPGISGGVAFGKIPPLAFITDIMVHVVTAFNAGTTNVLTIGTTKATANDIVAASPTLTATGYTNITAAAGLGMVVTAAATSDITLYAKYAQTGAAATAGQVVLCMRYIMPNDL